MNLKEKNRQPEPLAVEQLAWRCDPAWCDFETTHDLADLENVLGQARALEAIRFGVGIRRDGFNLFVLGPPGMGKRTIVRQVLAEQAHGESTPDDWCYVHNFQQPYKPRAIRLKAGRGRAFQSDIKELVEDLRAAIPAALESDEFGQRLEEIKHDFEQQHNESLERVSQSAEQQGIRLIRTPGGFALAPLRDGEVIDPEEFEKLSEDEQKQVQEKVSALQEELQKILRRVPEWRKETVDKIKQLKREAAQFAIGHSIAQVKQKYADVPEVAEYLNVVESDVVEHADAFLPAEDSPLKMLGLGDGDGAPLRDYEVNLLVDNGDTQGAPVVYEDFPNYHTLIGRVDHRSQMGSLVTDFTLIKAGALHRANGGYLILEMVKVLKQPYAWEALKRVLSARQIKIESLGEALSLVGTVSLEPELIPLDVKVVLIGDRLLYYLLHAYDAEFPELFKVAADFEEEIPRNEENCRQYAQLVATLVRREELKPFDRTAVARVLEHGARLADDSERLSTHLHSLCDVLREADFWAGDAAAVSAEHVQRAIEQRVYRSDRVRTRIQEEIERGTILIDTEGRQVGQVNGLSVMELGGFRFGRPSRITANVRLGKGEVVDIEREVELGGALHSKGVLILGSFLASRYSREQPLSLAASLVFEQSYGPVDGDSASTAETCALLSALAETPLMQNFAVTGSINQHGQVQAIGGVNEKIEGFFDVCRRHGLTGEQGVLIPAANVKHLMLRQDVVAAVERGEFRVVPLHTIDDALTLLTGTPAGEPDEKGVYPAGTVNARVMERLDHFARLRRQYAESLQKGGPPHE
ncbi:MAG: ATP-binding protein [Pirellulaceae bacterium]